MTDRRDAAGERPEQPEKVPLGQRLYDNWWVMLIAGFVVMAITYTGWGLLEVTRLPPAPLP